MILLAALFIYMHHSRPFPELGTPASHVQVVRQIPAMRFQPMIRIEPIGQKSDDPQPVQQSADQQKSNVAQPSSDKFDGECDPTATIGRCADKCPAPEFVRGFDKVTGAAICGHVTGCPYGDSIPMDQCAKFALEDAKG